MAQHVLVTAGMESSGSSIDECSRSSELSHAWRLGTDA